YEITFETAFQSPLWLTVHDMLGQKLVENLIRKNFNSYTYSLDMSHVATGVYLVRIGTRDEGRVARIIVH
ncbi:MAG: T9SS type A sorting domain-containing protein, partial [Salinimicrobium sediminis]|nr:T9SS type A sorting domain-containing protein [Salinimicrobium sediminis]